MPVSALHKCLEYLINCTDVAPRHARGELGGVVREGEKKDLKNEGWRVQVEKQWMRLKKEQETEWKQGHGVYEYILTIEWEMLNKGGLQMEREREGTKDR